MNSNESMMLIKTIETNIDNIKDYLKLKHPYDTPEVVALPIVGGSEPYLAWIRDEVAE